MTHALEFSRLLALLLLIVISMILDGCKDLDEAKKKVNKLSDTPKKEKED